MKIEQNQVRQPDHLEDNPIALDDKVAESLVPHLDELQASLFVLFHQYQKHHWLVEGPQFLTIHEYLQKKYEQIHEQVDEIAERVTYLGGIPTSSPARLAEVSLIEHEPEGQFSLRDMLKRDLVHEQEIAKRFRIVIGQATQLGDYGTETLLKAILMKIEERAHELDHFLGEDSLEEDRQSYDGKAVQTQG